MAIVDRAVKKLEFFYLESKHLERFHSIQNIVPNLKLIQIR